MKFKIYSRWSSEVKCEVEIADSFAEKPMPEQKGEAVKVALKNGSDLSNSDLSNSDLSYSDLRDSNLIGSDLSNSDLSNSDLRGSNLSGSDLRGSDLRYSNLRGSNLRGSNLSDSNLRGSDLRGSDLSGSKQTINPLCIVGMNWWILVSRTHLQIGCKTYSHQEWSELSDEQIAAMDSQALEFWTTNKTMLLSVCEQHAAKSEAAAQKEQTV
jgi:hypothetical protein